MANIIHLPSVKMRPYQRQPFRDLFVNNIRRILLLLPRRAGKDRLCINLIHMAALKRPGLYYYLLPTISQARTVIWDGRGSDGKRFIDCIPNALISKDYQTTTTRKLSNGSIIRITGSNNYEALIGSNPLGIVFSEYSLTNPSAWNYLRPILSENNGWAVFPYTPRGYNHGWDLYNDNQNNPDWSILRLTAEELFDNEGNRIITDDMIEAERRAGMPEELIRQEYYTDFTATMLGAYFPDEMKAVGIEGRIRKLVINPNLPVHTSWDIGVDDKNIIILWQKEGINFKALYHYENSRKGMWYYIDELERIKKQLGIRNWGIHFAPHDIMVQEYGTGKTRYMQALEKGFRFQVAPKVSDPEGIQCIRYILPKIQFDSDHCKVLVKALTEYKSDYNFEKKVFGLKAVHDWTSHSVKAVQYFAVGFMNSFDQPQFNQQRVYARQMP